MFFKSVCSFLGRRLRNAFVAGPISLVLSGVFLCPHQAEGWGSSGHESVAYIAWQQMTPTARSRAIELLKLVPTLHNPENTKSIPGYAEWVADLPAGLSQDQQNLYLFMRAATWVDTIKHEWLQDSDTPPPGITTDVNIGFTDTASHGYWHFVDNGFSSDKSQVPDTPVPNAATQIVALRLAIASNEDDGLKAYDLVWLEHLVGDIHQPLHGAVRYNQGAGDIGGNAVKIKMTTAMHKTFEGTLSHSYPTNLHAFWDDLPGEGQPGPALPQAETFAQTLPAASKKAAANTDPSKWTMESFKMAKKDAYKKPIGPGLQTGSGAGYMITQAYYDKGLKDAKVRVALAGARLAKLLNENLH